MGGPRLELIIFVAAFIANLSIFITVFRYANKDQSRFLFLSFLLAQILWITVNYLSFNTFDSPFFLLITRLTLSFAALHTAALYVFVSNFLDETPLPKKKYSVTVLCFGVLIATLAVGTGFFSGIGEKSHGIPSPTTGPLLPFFGLFVAFCILASFYSMLKNYSKSTGIQKFQWRFLTIGLISTFILVLIFSFLTFVLLGNPTTVKFGHLYTLPFVVFTAYAMIKHKLLDVKAVLAEIMVIVINSIIFIQLINSQTTLQFSVSGLLIIGTVIGGIFLIKSVEREVKQREQLEILSKELAEANEKLKALDQARAEFITIASHQLRTPPATIKWYLSAVLGGDYGKVPAKILEQLKRTQNTNNHLISLIEDMLNVSRIERGKMEFLFEPCNTEELARFSYEQLLPIAEDKKLKLTYQAPKKPLPQIMADKEKLRQVMNNLIDNALKYTKIGTVAVNIFQDGNEIKFSVKDSGKGIGPEDQNSIFQKYSRGKESVKQSAGLGLGLYVAKIIIDQHKGKIWAESEGDGKGSTFSFSLPINSGLQQTTLVDLSKKN